MKNFSLKKINFNNIVKKVVRWLIVIAAMTAFLYSFNQIDKQEIANTTNRDFQKGVVTAILIDNVTEDGSRSGSQTVLVELTTGSLKGEVVEATSSDGYLFGATCEVGTKVIVIQSIYEDIVNVTVYSYDRGMALLGYCLMFILIVALIGGWKGCKAIIALLFTLIFIIFFYLPFIYRGYSPFLGAVIVAIITTLFTMYMIGGWSKKTISATLGTVLGVIASGLFGHLFGVLCNITGYNVSNIESLTVLESINNMNIGELLFAGLLISSLGAVMDVAMSISSSINEIHEKSPELSFIELVKSGLTVGRDTMGTMINTLILSFTGGSLSVLVLDYAYDLPVLQLINSNTILIEIMQGLSGSLGIVITVPCVSIIAAFLATHAIHFRKKKPIEKIEETAS